jgi:hypothetical protein
MSWILVVAGAAIGGGGMAAYANNRPKSQGGKVDSGDKWGYILPGVLGGGLLGAGGSAMLGGSAAAGSGASGGALTNAFASQQATMPMLSAPASFGSSAPMMGSTASLGGSTYALGGGAGGLGATQLSSGLPALGSGLEGMGGEIGGQSNSLFKSFMQRAMNSKMGNQGQSGQETTQQNTQKLNNEFKNILEQLTKKDKEEKQILSPWSLTSPNYYGGY